MSEVSDGFCSAYYFADFNKLVSFANKITTRNFIIFFDEIFSVLEKKGALNKQSLLFLN